MRGDGRLSVGGRGLDVGGQDDLRDGAPCRPLRLVVAGVDEEAMETGLAPGRGTQPAVEPVRVTQPADVAPGGDERVLDGVLRAVLVPDDKARGRGQA